MVISSLQIGAASDGFDLDRDNKPDNLLAPLASLANSALGDAFANYELLVPMEFFDFARPAVDECVKFAVYVGHYKLDRDGDGQVTAAPGGDCNDGDPKLARGTIEIVGNGVDDDCDGLADETAQVPSDNIQDADGDGVTIAAGDCDDTRTDVRGPGAVEVCGDGLDNNCDGVADWGVLSGAAPMCSPYDQTPDVIEIDPLSFASDGWPRIAFEAGKVSDEAGHLVLRAGPDQFVVKLPLAAAGVAIELRMSGTHVVADVVMTPSGWTLVNGRLGGVVDAVTADQVRGLEVAAIGLRPEDSFLDATFANVFVRTLLGLDVVSELRKKYGDCVRPDIDVDQDGHETFCDSHPHDTAYVIDVCIDGDGTVYRDQLDARGAVSKHCTEFVDAKGAPRFVDGASVEMNFETVAALLTRSRPAR